VSQYKAMEQLQTEAVAMPAAAMSGQVLVAEDIKANQMLIQILLQKMGFNVMMVENGQQAVEQCRKEIFDMIFMDMQMPVMNGYEATRQIRGMGIQIPIIAATAHAMKGDEEKCMSAGCNGYVVKPIDRKKLEEMIREHFSQNADTQNIETA
jgi:CheY-like chemotaxis protein